MQQPPATTSRKELLEQWKTSRTGAKSAVFMPPKKPLSSKENTPPSTATQVLDEKVMRHVSTPTAMQQQQHRYRMNEATPQPVKQLPATLEIPSVSTLNTPIFTTATTTTTTTTTLPSSASKISTEQMMAWIKKVEREKFQLEEQKYQSRIETLTETIQTLKSDMQQRYQQHYEQLCQERNKVSELTSKLQRVQAEYEQKVETLRKLSQESVPKREFQHIKAEYEHAIKVQREDALWRTEIEQQLVELDEQRQVQDQQLTRLAEHLQEKDEQVQEIQFALMTVRTERDQLMGQTEELREALTETIQDNERLYAQLDELALRADQKVEANTQTDDIVEPTQPSMMDGVTQTEVTPLGVEQAVQTDSTAPTSPKKPAVVKEHKNVREMDIVKQAEFAIREYNTMKFANALMVEQVLIITTWTCFIVHVA